MDGKGSSLSLLVVCRNVEAEEHLREAGCGLPTLITTQELAFAGPPTGNATVWRLDRTRVALLCMG